MSDNSKISFKDLQIDYDDGQNDVMNLKEIKQISEKSTIIKALAQSKGNISETARLLGISRPTFYGLLKQYNINIEK